jgi:hypothetical protein
MVSLEDRFSLYMHKNLEMQFEFFSMDLFLHGGKKPYFETLTIEKIPKFSQVRKEFAS